MDEISGTAGNTVKKGFADDIRQVGVVTQYEILKHLRSKRFFIFAGIAGLVFLLITVLNFIFEGGLPDDPRKFMKMYMGLVYIMVILGVSLLCASTIASEFEERTALLMFPRPIKKTSFFAGKVLACYIICGLIVIIYYLVCMIVSVIAAGGICPDTFGSLGMALLYMVGAGGFALVMSSLFKKSSSAIIVTIMILFMVFLIVDNIMISSGVEPMFSINYAGKDILNFVSRDPTGIYDFDLTPYGFKDMTFTTANPTHAMAAWICAIWAAVTTVISAILFKRREF